jgi:hypothetical protein
MFNLAGLLVRTALIHMALICFYLLVSVFERGCTRLAVSSLIFLIVSIFTTIIFRVWFGEMLQRKHYVGMAMITIAVFYLAYVEEWYFEWKMLFFVLLNSAVLIAVTFSGRFWTILGGGV